MFCICSGVCTLLLIYVLIFSNRIALRFYFTKHYLLFLYARCYARLHPRAVNCRKKKCGHSNQVRLVFLFLFLLKAWYLVCFNSSCCELLSADFWQKLYNIVNVILHLAVEAKEEDQVNSAPLLCLASPIIIWKVILGPRYPVCGLHHNGFFSTVGQHLRMCSNIYMKILWWFLSYHIHVHVVIFFPG